MASRAPVLALKTTAVIAVFTALVLPSLGRCPSLGPEPPQSAPMPPPSAPELAMGPPPPLSTPTTPPTPPPSMATLPPAPAPGPAPPVLCSDCPSHCTSTCASACSNQCGPMPNCDACTSRELEKCKACCGNGTCSCDCNTTVGIACYTTCYSEYRPCHVCKSGVIWACENSCRSRCYDTCM